MLGRAVTRYMQKSGIRKQVSVHLMRPPSPEMGDYASNIALLLSEQAGKKPADVAGEIIALIEDPESLLDEDVTIAGKGFMNFKIKVEEWYRMVPEVRSTGEAFFRASESTGRKILVEFVSANPTGPLHVGHGRGAVMGDVLVNILKAAGNDADAEYYVNDRGRQVQGLGVSLHYRYNELFKPDFPRPEGENWYRGAYLVDLAKELKAGHGSSLLAEAPESPVFKDFGVNRLIEILKEDLEALGVTFNIWFRESQITEDILQNMISSLKHKGYIRENEDGSIAFKIEGEDRDEEKERILVKRTGDYTYFATDFPYHIDKIERGYGQLINVWGADHHGYIPRMKAALKAMGHDPEILKVLLVQMVSLMRGGEPVKMSKRSGDFVTLREVVDEVGSDAFRFIFLTRRPDSQFEFDIEAAKKKNLDNPVYYVQYGYARLCSILKRARERFNVNLNSCSNEEIVGLLQSKLKREDEKAILKNALRLNEVIGDAARTLQPHRIATYVMDMSKDLQSYYTVSWRVDKDPVLPPEARLGQEKRFPADWDADRSLARLLWIDAVRIAMKAALNLMGVAAPERMERIDEGEEEKN